MKSFNIIKRKRVVATPLRIVNIVYSNIKNSMIAISGCSRSLKGMLLRIAGHRDINRAKQILSELQHLTMKAIYVVPLLLCAYAHAAVLQNDEVTSTFKAEGLHVNMLARDHVFSKEDQLSANEVAALDAVAFNFLEDRIKAVLDDLRPVIVNGNDNVPVLDPLEIERIGPLSVDIAVGTRASLVINDFHLDGLRWFVVDDVTFSPLRLTLGVHVTVPWLTATGNYEADARLAILVQHTAGGNYRIFVNRLEVGVDVRLGTNLLGGHLLLRELDIKIDIQDINIRIDGMVGSSVLNGLINTFVQSITRDFVQNEMENVSNMLSEELFDTINELLKEYTLADILG